MKGCALFVAVFLLGVGLVIGGVVCDLMLPGGPFRAPTPGIGTREENRDLPRTLEVAGVAVVFGAIYGAAGWRFSRRKRDPESQSSDSV